MNAVFLLIWIFSWFFLQLYLNGLFPEAILLLWAILPTAACGRPVSAVISSAVFGMFYDAAYGRPFPFTAIAMGLSAAIVNTIMPAPGSNRSVSYALCGIAACALLNAISGIEQIIYWQTVDAATVNFSQIIPSAILGGIFFPSILKIRDYFASQLELPLVFNKKRPGFYHTMEEQ